ncbi:hypothetical protein [Sorangium sp. So ce388]|uniref:hypothetical protein n=1 Tax=Sorangium sp. So ce388 TaxID=3133309 RepID=UPI003F5C26A2
MGKPDDLTVEGRLKDLRGLAQAARVRADAASSGPWLITATADGTAVLYRELHHMAPDAAEVIVEADWATEADMNFLATARSDVPALADALEQLVDELERRRDVPTS